MAKGSYIGIGGVARKIKGGYAGVDGVARKIKKAYIGVNGVARLFYSAEVQVFLLGDLPLGSKIMFGRFGATELLWNIVDTQKKADGYITVSLDFSTRLDAKAFDAAEPGNPDTSAASNGYYRYRYSNIRQWLNSEYIQWYYPMHTYDASPVYANYVGFLNGFTTAERNRIVNTQINTVIDGGTIETVTDKIWLPSGKSLGLPLAQAGGEDDRVFEAFSSFASRVWGTERYWLRTPDTTNYRFLYYVSSSGSAFTTTPRDTATYVRSFCNLDVSTPMVYDSANDRYVLA
jgi:hypothetical protein